MKKFGEEASRIKPKELDNTLSNFFSFIKGLNLKKCRVIGSAANKSKTSMGDIDMVVDEKDISRKEMFEWFKDHMDNSLVSNKGVLSILFPIYSCENDKTKRLVQIDFMFGNPDVLYHTYYSPEYGVDCHKDSPLKAVHRIKLIAFFCWKYPLSELFQSNADHPLYQSMMVRWKWSMKEGLQLIQEMKLINDGKYQDGGNKVIKTIEPDFDVMAKALFNEQATGDSLKSAETFLDSIAKYTREDILLFVDEFCDSPHYKNDLTDKDRRYLRKYASGRLQTTKRTIGKQTVSKQDKTVKI